MTSVWDSKLGSVKTKGGDKRTWKTACPPLKQMKKGEILSHKDKYVPPKRRRKAIDTLYKIHIKKVLIYN
jgi:hypothetical protein